MKEGEFEHLEPACIAPKLDGRKVWLSLLLPSVLLLLGSVPMYVLMVERGSFKDDWTVFIGMHLFWLSGLLCWVIFGRAVFERIRGRGWLLLVLAYPIVQVVLGITIYFGVCALVVELGDVNL